ncbi:MAG TPA: hypothetical protein VFT58_02065, partial [Nitrososphaera sp.]|nr:hypothetical protein [Nitrososphaera sp.]
MKQKLALAVVAVLALSILSFPVLSFAQENQETDDPTTETSSEEKESQDLQLPGVAPQGYGARQNLRTGTVVQPDPEDSSRVIQATQDKLEAAFGIVV